MKLKTQSRKLDGDIVISVPLCERRTGLADTKFKSVPCIHCYEG